MYQQIKNVQEETKYLDPIYVDQVVLGINQAGPLLGVLEVKAYFLPLESPPAPSPVGAHLVNVSFKTWRDISYHLKQLERFYKGGLGRGAYKTWSRNIIKLCEDKPIMLAYTIPLFAENQMNSMTNYPSPAQDVFLKLLSPIIESNAKVMNDDSQYLNSQKAPNALIKVFLFAGQSPFTMTCHGKATMLKWKNRLEAATALLLPQVIFEVEQELPDHAKTIMRKALNEEVRSWHKQRPSIGDTRDWMWLPKLI